MDAKTRIQRAAAAGMLLVSLAACSKVAVLEGLDERQANEVVATLLRQNIEADKTANGKSGYSVTVDEANLVQAIDLMREHDLPRAPRGQISDAFPADAMISTPLSEKARLLSAVEQRLEESLSVLDGVRSARVHVSYDGVDDSSGVAKRAGKAKHVAVVLVHEQGIHEATLVQNSKRFLRNAFEDLSYDDVSVVLAQANATRVLAVTPAASSLQGWLAGLIACVLGLLLGALWMMRRGLSRAWASLSSRLPRSKQSADHAGA
ncbi:type III secretion inner membrane ring lipoprotein SctJ [Stenotrophomonas sp. B1-1]|uniref:type III secretion system inner membrane ring lipoprotein SctJ n=1 Tax=Stenotrophomonas sp. B1-1 TaxID=2710648 RepID=UPI0023DE0AB6|nr:type III secretion inner membrane ring lipoprotein SctJ [Stenotrophomonas sp. B1-1]